MNIVPARPQKAFPAQAAASQKFPSPVSLTFVPEIPLRWFGAGISVLTRFESLCRLGLFGGTTRILSHAMPFAYAHVCLETGASISPVTIESNRAVCIALARTGTRCLRNLARGGVKKQQQYCESRFQAGHCRRIRWRQESLIFARGG